MDNAILAEAIEAMAAPGVGKMNAFIRKYGGNTDATMREDGSGRPEQQHDPAWMLGRECDLLRAVAALALQKGH